MRVLMVQPGASYSTDDVYRGLKHGLESHGVEVIEYLLDQRLVASGHWLALLRRRAAKAGRALPPPGPGDVIYHACSGLLERALRHEVDVVIVVSGMYLHPDWMILMQRAGIKLGVVLTESPYDDANQGPFITHCDVAWTNERTSVPFLRQYNENVYYLPHAYDPVRHYQSTPVDSFMPEYPGHDVVFVGTGFEERIETLRGVDWEGIDFGLYGEWSLLGSRSRLRKHLRSGPIFNDLTALLYRRSKIGLNLYRTSIGFGGKGHIRDAHSLNPRALELAAMGVFTISDYRPEVGEVFGHLVPTFTDPADLEDIIRHYLLHPEERERIARQLPACVADWTFERRALQMLNDMVQSGLLEVVDSAPNPQTEIANVGA